MASNLENTIQNAAAKLAAALEQATELTIETMYVEVGDDGTTDFKEAKPIARTIIKLDGDYQTIIPMRRTDTGALEHDQALLDLHTANVGEAIKYRQELLNSLLSILPTRRR